MVQYASLLHPTRCGYDLDNPLSGTNPTIKDLSGHASL
jgi:hypothetical protein